ncbi:flagellin lysine-N-methylase [Paenibacillus sp. sgz302251]|uniref:flagellin lysine-N-methylase n=1 Tax=Paenibacillus sp. sgz302251 TaxID=3414493 RepID=UPI003C7DC030
MQSRTVVSPHYMKQFSCLGSACEDTCCSGWQITIDKKTYKKYEEAYVQGEDHTIFQHIKKLTSKRCQENYAEIMLNKDSYCPLLNQDRLCSIHAQKGEEHLSNLCVTYPRVSNVVNGAYERSATVSCPEAARLVLLNPEGIRFEKLDESEDERHLVMTTMSTTEETVLKQQLHFLELRAFTIKLLQNRSFSLNQRILFLGMFLSHLKERLETEDPKNIPLFISSFERDIQDGSIVHRLPQFPRSSGKRLQILRKLIDMRLFAGVKDQRYLQCLLEALDGIRFTGESLTEETLELYCQFNQSLFAPFMLQHGYILENFLVNYVFKNLFPSKRDMFEEYVLLVLHFSLIKLHLIGMMGYHKTSFSIDHVVKVIQSYSRTVEHAADELRRFLTYFNEKEYSNLETMSNLVMDEG